MLERIRQLFGGLPAGGRPSRRSSRPNRSSTASSRVVGRRAGRDAYVEIAYHAPGRHVTDFFPLTVLDSVLAGASSLNMFGGGISNKTSRLYRALVESELAAAVGGGLAATIDPYLYSIQATVRPDRTPEQALEAFDERSTACSTSR